MEKNQEENGKNSVKNRTQQKDCEGITEKKKKLKEMCDQQRKQEDRAVRNVEKRLKLNRLKIRGKHLK